MITTRYPLLYQVNTRVLLTALAHDLDRAATLNDIPDAELDLFAARGFNWIWFLGIWQTGLAGRRISLSDAALRHEYGKALPDFEEADVIGSCFAVRDYTVHEDFGGDEALGRLRYRLHQRGLRLMLDFVSNHTALDHPWVRQHPDYYVRGNEAWLKSEPHNYTRAVTDTGPLILANGRDPYFPGWTDTLQLNYANPALQDAMIRELDRVAARCDGVRCDMAMLVLPDIFARTWGLAVEPFWPRAIDETRKHHAGFLFMAEAYWNLESILLQQGFDYSYDKDFYDKLRTQQPSSVRNHLYANPDGRLARFLENHDEPRAAAVFPPEVHRAAAVITYLSPCLRFFHQGQLDGLKVHIPIQLRRGPREPGDREMQDFYRALLDRLHHPAVREGDWRLLECHPAWEGNWTWDCIIAFAWEGPGGRRIVAVNYADHRSQCYVPLPFKDLAGNSWTLRDLMSNACYTRDGAGLVSPGLYLDLPEWGYHVFEITTSDI